MGDECGADRPARLPGVSGRLWTEVQLRPHGLAGTGALGHAPAGGQGLDQQQSPAPVGIGGRELPRGQGGVGVGHLDAQEPGGGRVDQAQREVHPGTRPWSTALALSSATISRAASEAEVPCGTPQVSS